MTMHDNDMVNLRAALACEYAANSLRAAHTYESASHIYSFDASFSIAARSGDGIENLRQAVELLGFKLTPIVNSNGDQPATEPQDTPILSTAGAALNTAPAPQYIDQHAGGYSAGLSGKDGVMSTKTIPDDGLTPIGLWALGQIKRPIPHVKKRLKRLNSHRTFGVNIFGLRIVYHRVTSELTWYLPLKNGVYMWSAATGLAWHKYEWKQP